MKYFGQPDFQHGEVPAVGVLLANLGTPDAPTAPALRRYLREFLLDPRVIEMNRALWWTILHVAILPTRPKVSAALYRKVWTAEGSPLLVISRRQAAAVAAVLAREVGTPLHVAVGMRYGNPSIRAALRELAGKGCRRILVLPLYPQYAAVTTGSTFDAVAAELATWRWVPEVRTVHHYHDVPAYTDALAASIREAWATGGQAEKLLFSFHGIPQRYFDAGDPYFCNCHKTARLAAERLGLPRERWEISFQSLFGREEWIKPYSEKTIKAMARSGVKSLDVVCPGFSADCLETLEEIDEQNREFFLHAGGESYRYIPALNDRPDHVRVLADIVQANLAGWVVPAGQWDAKRARAEAEASRQRAEALAAAPIPLDGGYGS
ncbi:MAG: protoporphyrin/coproporphyrin ferrochelatase [Acidobacteriota bacterium]|jgi:ferrochelatase|nr:protoporphyrin/coproporphyrin ferrochelatase [Acidobacteriota bacterium]